MATNTALLRRKQALPTLTAQSLHLPFDLITEILCKLSVKQLIQFRCVCKSWNSLISEDSNFAKMQLRLSTSCQGRHHLILKSTQFIHLQYPISTILSSKGTTMPGYSLKKGESVGGYVSTCDGILCYTLHRSLDSSSAFLFNPSIRKFILLPSLKRPGYHQILYTLVYDRFINNYKVIALITNRQVNVHILGTHCWTRIPDFPTNDVQVCRTRQGIFVSDSVNWLVPKLIVSLDLEKESYQKLSLPQSTTSGIVFLETLRGCLSLLFSGKCSADVWIMKEFGNEKSWTKLFTVSYLKAWGRCHVTKVLYISEDDQVLLEFLVMDYNFRFAFVVYDSINNTFQFPKFQNKIPDNAVATVFVESLISPF